MALYPRNGQLFTKYSSCEFATLIPLAHVLWICFWFVLMYTTEDCCVFVLCALKGNVRHAAERPVAIPVVHHD